MDSRYRNQGLMGDVIRRLGDSKMTLFDPVEQQVGELNVAKAVSFSLSRFCHTLVPE